MSKRASLSGQGREIGGSEEREGRRRLSASQPGREGRREGGTEGRRVLYMNWQRAHRRSGTAGVRSRFESRVGHGALHPVLHTRPNQ